MRWYRENFRCAVDYEDDTWALLDFANVKLALVLPDLEGRSWDLVTSTDDPEIRRYGINCLRILGIGYPMYAVGMIIIQAVPVSELAV